MKSILKICEYSKCHRIFIKKTYNNKYCSKKCKLKRDNEIKVQKRKLVNGGRFCQWPGCEKEITGSPAQSKYCKLHSIINEKKKAIERTRKWEKENPERRRKNNRNWKRNNPDKAWHRKYPEKNKQSSINWRKSNPDKVKENSLIKRTRRKGAGEIPKGSYNRLMELQEGLCSNVFCQCSLKELPAGQISVDHIVPITRGGMSNFDNLQLMCRSCNSSKNNKTMPEFYEYLINIKINENS